MPAIVQPVNLAVPDAADQIAPVNGVVPIVPVASLPEQISDRPPPDNVPGPPVAMKVELPSYDHVTAPAVDDITPKSDISDATNTHMRMILLISFSYFYELLYEERLLPEPAGCRPAAQGAAGDDLLPEPIRHN
jgi:hypothetical protein